MLEILPNIYYDPNKEWYQQPQELIDLALEVEKTAPIDFQMGVDGNHERLKYSVWEHTTEIGTFEMRVDIIYMYNITHRAFLSKKLHNKVTIIKK